MWAPHRPEPRTHRPELRTHGHQMGGFAPLGARHAGDTPKGGIKWRKPPPLPLASYSLTGAGLTGGVPINAGGASPAMTGEVTGGQLRDKACDR